MSGAESISYPYEPPNRRGSDTKTTYISQPIYDVAPREILEAVFNTQQVMQTVETAPDDPDKERTVLTTMFEKTELEIGRERKMQLGGAVAAIVVTDEPNLFIAELTSLPSDKRFPALPTEVWVRVGRIADHMPTTVRVEVADGTSFSGELGTAATEATRQFITDGIHRSIGKYVANLPQLIDKYRESQVEAASNLHIPIPQEQTLRLVGEAA